MRRGPSCNRVECHTTQGGARGNEVHAVGHTKQAPVEGLKCRGSVCVGKLR